MDYLYFVVGGFVILIALFKRELLVQVPSSKVILLISTILFCIGVILQFTEVGKGTLSGFLLCPLITLLQYWLSRNLFLKWVGREPKDTAFVYSGEGIGKDRLFNLLYFIPAFWLMMLDLS